MREKKRTPNAERRTPNIESFSDFNVGRSPAWGTAPKAFGGWTLGVGHWVFLEAS
jgi:hypothetical protein